MYKKRVVAPFWCCYGSRNLENGASGRKANNHLLLALVRPGMRAGVFELRFEGKSYGRLVSSNVKHMREVTRSVKKVRHAVIHTSTWMAVIKGRKCQY